MSGFYVYYGPEEREIGVVQTKKFNGHSLNLQLNHPQFLRDIVRSIIKCNFLLAELESAVDI